MKKLTAVVFCGLAISGVSRAVSAMELDWSGQFRSEFNWLRDYALDNVGPGGSPGSPDPNRANPAGTGGTPGFNGYYIQPAGTNNASFETLFLKLQPKLVVNDNIYIKSEFWLGDPTYGFYGGGSPQQLDEKYYDSTFSRGSAITAQRYWVEFLTDFGTLQVGRVPLNYGLGIVWNAGDSLWDHYESTGDAVRLISRFGAFTFSPAVITYSIGNTVGGSCTWDAATGLCAPGSGGSAGVTDYSLLFKYDNPDEDFSGSLNFIRRLGGAAQDPGITGAPGGGYLGQSGSALGLSATGFAYNIWDIYMKKRLWGKLTLSGEVPITTGSMGGLNYSTWAAAAEANYKMSDTWEFNLKLGHAPGQDAIPSGSLPSNYTAFYFHPNYKLGMIMFNYALQNLGGLNTLNNSLATSANLLSPYANSIEDANYAAIEGLMHADKWTFDAGLIYAVAPTTAQGGSNFFNNWYRGYSSTAAIENQGDQLGWEGDLGAAFQYDEYFQFRLDMGIYFPGNFYAFSNDAIGGVPIENQTSIMWGGVARVGVNF